jgi:hypothetical protein
MAEKGLLFSMFSRIGFCVGLEIFLFFRSMGLLDFMV